MPILKQSKHTWAFKNQTKVSFPLDLLGINCYWRWDGRHTRKPVPPSTISMAIINHCKSFLHQPTVFHYCIWFEIGQC